ncbi:glutaminase [Streptomyces litmocidini]|uniref:glutaminase n=1 Tax=Streptomyces litmocidini TaxID=67318 RepID=UPI0033E5C6CE
MAVAEPDGTVYGVRRLAAALLDAVPPKVFALALVLSPEGERIWQGVGREPSGNPFDSPVRSEYEHGVPRNPFTDAGALLVTDRPQTLTGDAAGRVRELLRAESGDPAIDFVPESVSGGRTRPRRHTSNGPHRVGAGRSSTREPAGGGNPAGPAYPERPQALETRMPQILCSTPPPITASVPGTGGPVHTASAVRTRGTEALHPPRVRRG